MGRAGGPLSALWGSEAGPGPAMLAVQAVDAGASALPASPTRSCRLHLPRPGTQRPLGGGDEGLWIRPGLGTPAGRGRPLVPLAHAGALDTEGGSEKEGPAARLWGFPRVPRSPDPPVGCLSQDAPHPKALSCNPTSQMGKRRPREGEGRSAHAQLRRPPWALTLQPPSVPAKSCSWNCPGNQHGRGKEAALWAGGALGAAPASSLPSP